jgi:acetyl-CoA C-acetyltransferase
MSLGLYSVCIAGAAALPVGRLSARAGTQPEVLEHDLLAEVAWQALNNAGIDASEVGSLVMTLPPPSTRQLGLATLMASHLGLKCRGRIAEVVEMGITGGLAFDQAVSDVALGYADFALAMGISLDGNTPSAEAANNGMRTVGDVDFQSPFGVTPVSWYALGATRYMYETGTTRRDLAAVAVKSRNHALQNPLAQMRGKPITEDDVISQRPIVSPLGLLDVPPRGEGAVAVVVGRIDALRGRAKPIVRIRSRGFAHDGHHQMGSRHHDMTDYPAARAATQSALKSAGLSLGDVDVAELYAPCTITEILVTESIGISERGKGTRDARDGHTSVGGRLPINTSGGCLSRGHPPALTGLYGLVEIQDQLLGRCGTRQVSGATVGLHCCELGHYNAALVHVLELMS